MHVLTHAGVHAVHENEPAFAHDGYLLILTNKVWYVVSDIKHVPCGLTHSYLVLRSHKNITWL